MKKSSGAQALRAIPGGDPPKWRARRLKSLEDVRRYLADLVNRTEAEKIEDQKAARLANMANILAGMIRDSDLEARLANLEQAARESRK